MRLSYKEIPSKSTCLREEKYPSISKLKCQLFEEILKNLEADSSRREIAYKAPKLLNQFFHHLLIPCFIKRRLFCGTFHSIYTVLHITLRFSKSHYPTFLKRYVTANNPAIANNTSKPGVLISLFVCTCGSHGA